MSDLARLDAIEHVVARHFELAPRELRSKRRTTAFCRARQVAAFLMRERASGATYAEIGRRLGERDHSTMIHAIRVEKARIKRDPSEATFLEHLREHVAREVAREVARR